MTNSLAIDGYVPPPKQPPRKAPVITASTKAEEQAASHAVAVSAEGGPDNKIDVMHILREFPA